jgi:hypothetical protein
MMRKKKKKKKNHLASAASEVARHDDSSVTCNRLLAANTLATNEVASRVTANQQLIDDLGIAF